MDKEKILRQYLIDEARKMGGNVLHVGYKNTQGYPSNILQLPGGRTIFIRFDEAQNELQKKRIHELQDRGHLVFVLTTKEAIDWLLWVERQRK